MEPMHVKEELAAPPPPPLLLLKQTTDEVAAVTRTEAEASCVAARRNIAVLHVCGRERERREEFPFFFEITRHDECFEEGLGERLNRRRLSFSLSIGGKEHRATRESLQLSRVAALFLSCLLCPQQQRRVDSTQTQRAKRATAKRKRAERERQTRWR